MYHRISFSIQNNLQLGLITSLFVRIEFVSSLRSQKMPFEVPDFERKKIFFCFVLPKMAPAWLEPEQRFFQSQRSQMIFSDFAMKKQIQSLQIWKRLKLIAIDFKRYQLILMYQQHTKNK